MNTADRIVTFEPPAPGCWELETTHHGLRPLTPFVREAYRRGGETGFAALVERYGLPLDGVAAKLVHGCLYLRPVGLGEGAKPSPTPPLLIMKLIARLHPAMRRRNRTAALAWKQRLWRTEVDQWFDTDRAVFVAQNLGFQRTDLAALDNVSLAAHIQSLLVHFEAGARRNLETHGGDLMPVGDLVAHGEKWGIGAAEIGDLLRGSSPATVETAHLLGPVAAALADAARPPTSVDDVRSIGSEVRAAVDSWLELHAWRLVTSDDLDHPTLAERPALQLQALLSAVAPAASGAASLPDPTSVRNRVPADQRALFDELLTEARYGMRQREDIRGLCWNWPGGLVRRALLEAGRRVVAAGRMHDAEQAVELFPEELTGLLVRGDGPSADVLAARAAQRDAIEAMPPPRMLGAPEAPPPLAALPRPMARATTALMAMLGADATPIDGRGALHGVGVGNTVYRGRARVVRDAADALDRIEPGDVLVAGFTGPSFNSLVPILGALVVEEGGALCHAAIVSREFGLPAVIGCGAATTAIPDGALVEVDPVAGVVRVL